MDIDIAQINSYLIIALGSSISALMALLAWIGSMVVKRLGEINVTMTHFTDKINSHDVRITVMEKELISLEKRKR